MVTIQKSAQHEDLPSHTSPPPPTIDATNEVISGPMISAKQNQDPTKEANEGDFHTPILNFKLVNEVGGANATHNDERTIHGEYDVILDVDTLYEDLPNPSNYALMAEYATKKI